MYLKHSRDLLSLFLITAYCAYSMITFIDSSFAQSAEQPGVILKEDIPKNLNLHDLEALQMLKSIVAGEELHFVKHGTYTSCKDAACLKTLELDHLVKHFPASLSVTMVSDTASDRYAGYAFHQEGGKKVLYWDSEAGGLVDTPPHINGKKLVPIKSLPSTGL